MLLNPEYDYYSYCDNIYLAKYLFKKLTIWFKYTTHIAHGNIKFSVIIHITGRETINMNTFSLNLSTDQVVNNFMYSCASFFTVPMELWRLALLYAHQSEYCEHCGHILFKFSKSTQLTIKNTVISAGEVTRLNLLTILINV